MSAPTDANKPATPATPVTPAPGPESPTTARPLEMDDDDVQEPGVLETSGTATAAAARAGEDAPPPKPPRPLTEQQKNQLMLKEAFPTLDEAVIKAVLTASGGRIDPAFNALLEMTDPDAANREVEDENPPTLPPRPGRRPRATPQSQLEADELYARQLAQHYENTGLDPSRIFGGGGGGGSRGRGQYQEEPERSFVDDDLPIIKENLRKGFQETQKTVNTWFQTMKKRFDEEFADDQPQHPQHQQGRPGQQGGSSRGGRDMGRRSGDYERYDADPQVLSDDFAGMKFHNDGTPVHNTRTSPNPNVFRPPPPSKSPRPGEDRKVSFREEADEIGDVYNVSPMSTGTAGTAGGGGGAAAPGAGAGAAKSSKWQPLSTVDPSPIAENDPFSLGDSDDEKDAAGSNGSKGAAASKPAAPASGEIKKEDAERLRKAAAEAMNESLVEDKKTGATDGAKKT
ncbi:hypothetical protein MAPG_09718 [Magnaporthiopsis poae ATCC 64411]|uniref:CUE domain-containing protein n=1 Tax=Magnaporthiopsis poae (strain ATCC 64411 / 73-15) TaxID=644358 RepID=A0A0C4EAP1_MAGP6|nr:hypothetical protein MAPG_09718 [Magnaporthiopsis poae ATCC 64411]